MLAGICVLFAGCKKGQEVVDNTPLPELKLTADDPAVEISEDGLTATISVDKAAAAFTLGVVSNLDWTLAEGNSSWVEAVPSEEGLTVEIDENEALDGRNAEFKISVENEKGALEAKVRISQTGIDAATLELSDETLEISADGGSIELGITTNQSTVNVQNEETWLTFSQGEDAITFTAGVNETGSFRSAEVTIVAGGGDNTATETVVISQDTKITLSISNKVIDIVPEGGSEEVTITSNHETIVIDKDADWVTVTKDGDKYTFTAGANETNSLRTTEVSVTAGAGDKTTTDKIVVSQNPHIKSLQYVVKTTSAGQEVGLPTLSSTDGTISITVDYGDGSTAETFTANLSSANKHAYANIGEYTVTITTDNIITAFSFRANARLYKVENNSLDMSGVKTVKECFYNCTNLISVSANVFSKCVEATNGESIFYGCKFLASVPAGLLGSLTKVTSFNGVFQNCAALSSVPSGLFQGLTAAKTVNSGFNGSGITEIPAKFFAGCSSMTQIYYTFYNCKSLATIAADAFEGCNKVTEFYAAFNSCTSLTSIPASMFSDMTGLSSIEYCFQSCENLTSIPTTLFDRNRNLKNYEYAFMNCTALTGESPYTMINGNKVHLYERENYPDDFQAPSGYDGCFRNDELLTDFATIAENGWN